MQIQVTEKILTAIENICQGAEMNAASLELEPEYNSQNMIGKILRTTVMNDRVEIASLQRFVEIVRKNMKEPQSKE